MSDEVQKKSLLSLDLSTSCVGYALFDIESKKLIDYGSFKPKVKNVSKMKYPLQQLSKMINIAEQTLELIRNLKPHHIVIEEIAGSKQRLGQKTLDGVHWIVLHYLLNQFPFERISYYDVTGLAGWRNNLQLRLTDADKANNKEAKKLNKKLSKDQQLPIVGVKDLSVRHVNHKYNLNFVLKQNDIADAICMGDAFLTFRCTEL